MPQPFHASRLKIFRALEHISELSRLLQDYNDSNPISNGVQEIDGGLFYVPRIEREIPERASSIIGDVVHNLRCSLDLMAAELVRMNGNSDKGVYFPFAASESELPDVIRRRNMHLAAPEVVELVKKFKPYRGGNAALRGIHDLDIQDKHSALIPAVGYVLLEGEKVDRAPLEDVRGLKPIPLRVPYAMMMDRSMIGSRRPLLFQVVFQFATVFEGQEMIPAFEDLAEQFSRTVDAFELLCFGAISEAFIPT